MDAYSTLSSVTWSLFATRRRASTYLSLLMLMMLLISNGVCKDTRKNQLVKQQRETNPLNFMRLLVLRLVYGIATMMGFEDSISEVANGAFVPPGVDDDYGGFDLDSRDSDYAYSDSDDDYY